MTAADTLVAARVAAILADDMSPTHGDSFVETAIAAFELQRGIVERAKALPFAEAARLLMIARHATQPEFMTEALILALLAVLQASAQAVQA